MADTITASPRAARARRSGWVALACGGTEGAFLPARTAGRLAADGLVFRATVTAAVFR